MTEPKDLIEKAKVVAKAFVTWAVIISGLLIGLSTQLGELAPDWEYTQVVTAWLIRIAVTLTAAVTIIRRHTPVAEDERGILPNTPKE